MIKIKDIAASLKGWGALAAVVALGLAATAVVYRIVESADAARVSAALDLRAEWRAKDTEHKIDVAAVPVRAVATYIASQAQIGSREAAEFRRFVLQAPGDTAPIRSIAWVPRVAGNERAAFEAGARSIGLKDYRIVEPGPDRKFRPAAERSEYFPVLLHVGFEGQASVVGVDMGSAEVRRDLVIRARDSGQAAATGQFGMLTLDNSIPSYLVAYPVYAGGGVPPTVEARRAAFRGVVYGAFQLRRVLSEAIQNTPEILGTIAFRFARAEDPNRQPIVAVYSPRSKTIEAAVSGADPTVQAAYRTVWSFENMGQRWTLAFGFPEDIVAAQRSAAPLAVLLAGLLLTATLGAYVARARRELGEVRDLVASRTAELRSGNAALKSAEAELRRANATMSTLLENLPVAVSLVGPDLRFLAFNSLFREDFGVTEDEIAVGDSYETFVRLIASRGYDGSRDPDVIVRDRMVLAKSQKPERFEATRPDGRTVDVRIAPIPGGGFVSARIDVTPLKTAQAEVEAARARLADWTAIASDWFWEADADGNLTFLSDSFDTRTGVKGARRIGRKRADLLLGDDGDEAKWQAHVAAHAARQPFRDFVFETSAFGHLLHLSVSGNPLFNETGAFIGYRGTTRDVTTQVEAERALERQTNTLSTLIDNLPIGVALMDRDLRLIALNQPYVTTLGLPPNFVAVGDPIEKVIRYNAIRGDYGAAADVDHLVGDFMAQLRSEQPRRYETALKDGRVIEINGRPLSSGGVISTFTDITERRRREMELEDAHKGLEAQAAELKQVNFDLRREVGKREEATSQLEAANAKLQALIDASPLPIVSLDTRRRVVTWNRAAERHFGYAAAEVLGRDYPLVPPERAAEFDALFKRSVAGENLRDVAVRRRHKDGRMLDVIFSGSPLYNADHRLVGVVYVLEDVTEKRKIERQIAQAVKMDAVGQLTGGIAHDFNNLLGIVIGNLDQQADTLDRHPEAVAEIKTLARDALDAALRGAELVRRLLAFSRSQPLQPQVIDLGRIAREMEPLLWRALGEHVTLETVVREDLWTVAADPTQLENVIVNLAINARDAMPGGGHIKVICANEALDEAAATVVELPAGDYVALSVADTGTGIPPDVLAHVFEPFFTTKEVGKGSGLGLSMVYGFARQSGGAVRIYTEQGRGTEVRVYLPRVRGEVSATEVSGAETAPAQGHERILLVEDKAEVRTMAARLLASLGYQIVEAESGVNAIEMMNRGVTFDLLFTDIVMPGNMTGIDLAHEVRRRWPTLPILLTSGFSDPETLHAEATSLGVQVLRKPYRKADLAEYLRTALDHAVGRTT